MFNVFNRSRSASSNKFGENCRKVNYDKNGGTVLYQAIEQRQWKSVISRIRHSPHEVSTYVYRIDESDNRGAKFRFMILPLHAAVMRQPPTLVVSTLIALYSLAVSKKCDGDLPLHVALKHGASLDVIHTLLLSFPEASEIVDEDGHKPLKIFQSNILLWQSESERDSISKLLKDGIDEIKYDDSKLDVKKKDDGSVKSGEVDLKTTINDEGWKQSGLSVIVIGASGDLAKKKTYPSLLRLFEDNLLPADTIIWGFARSPIKHEDLRNRLKPFLTKAGNFSSNTIDEFLSRCYYQQGQWYGDADAYKDLTSKIKKYESNLNHLISHNRLFYFAIPPNVFEETGVAIKQTAMADKGWTRIIIEKPFGRDLQSCEELLSTLSKNFNEEQMFRIDHYLGKEMVQNLLVMRFGNLWFEKIWDRDSIQCVMLTFKEPFGTDGRGGYFDKYGIIRDIIQNHLLQVLSLLAMEPPSKIDGPEAGESIRDAKVQVLKAIPPITVDDCFLGQYEGYTDDPTISNKDSNTPTFAVLRCFVHTPRWAGVPFIFKAGKALNERKAEMRIQFKDAPAATFLFETKCPRNELVMRMQPSEAIYIKTNVKSPGFSSDPIQSELEVNYNSRFFSSGGNEDNNPDAYTRLILDVLRGRSATFVREDELRRAWEIFTPILHKIEDDQIKPVVYARGSRGPDGADEFIMKKSGYVRNQDYVFFNGEVTRKSDVGTNPICDIGLYGLAVMGQNFALNIASHGFTICIGNRSPSKVDVTMKRAVTEGHLPVIASSNPKDFIQKLKRPRKVIILVQAGQAVDDTISKLSELMDKGDIIVDGGNEWYPNSIRRAKALEEKGIMFVSMGISGGEEGARNGPSLMPSGPRDAYSELERILSSCAAQVKDGACTTYIGPVGAGNFVKMIHNGIEYGDMQLIAEIYDILKNVVGLDNEEIGDVFSEWNNGMLESYLIDITSKILKKKDDVTGKGYVVDYILDKTGMKGTGRWSVQSAAEVSVAAPTISSALDARYISGRKDERAIASRLLKGPANASSKLKKADKRKFIEYLSKALYASKICSYAQGLGVIKAASDENNWNINLSECVRIWKGGCIIRAKLLDKIQAAFTSNPSLANLMVDPKIAGELTSCLESWRSVIIACTYKGIPCASLSGSLNYYDSYRTADLPANLTQAQRDYFGGHTFERNDREGPFHCAWTDTHKDIGNVNERTKGET